MKNESGKVDFENEAEFAKWCSSLKVPSTETHFVAIIEEHAKEIRNREIRKKEKYIEELSFSASYSKKRTVSTTPVVVMDIDVSKQQEKRAYIFMNYFIKSIMLVGGTVEVDTVNKDNKDNTKIIWHNVRLSCRLFEQRVKYRELKDRPYGLMIPSYTLVPTGKLIFTILDSDQKEIVQISDDNEIKIEHEIQFLFIELRKIIVALSQQIEQENEIKRKEDERSYHTWEMKWEAKKEEEQRENQRKQIENYRHQIGNQIAHWNELNKVKNYVEELRNSTGLISQENKEEIEKYCQYVETIFTKEEFYQEILAFIKMVQ